MEKLPSLHTMTEYSFLESVIKIDDLIDFANKNELKALAITDHNNMYGVAEFVHKARANNIKPLVGVDLDVDDFRLILLAKNYEGFQHIVKLVSKKCWDEKITLDMINTKDIFIIDHPQYGHYVKNGRELNLNNYYIATNDNLANALQFNYTRMLQKNNAIALKIVGQLSEKEEKNYENHYYAIADNKNTSYSQIQKIIDSINIKFPKATNMIPKFSKNENSNVFLKKVINKLSPTVLKTKVKDKEYLARIKMEMTIIENLGFSDYFLIIWDLIAWAKSNNIIIGPGRGSATGSIVSYILGITELDPIAYGLIFERFLNPERISMPDIDIDIQDNKREDVVNYLFEKYGKDNTALISTFQKLGAKSSLRDIGRLMGMPNNDVLGITKLVPNFSTLSQAYKTSVRFRAAIDRLEANSELLNSAKQIEGLPRQLGTHAAGIVISDKPIDDNAPVVKSSEGKNQVQYSMEYLEENNLLKIDLLGLRNLTIVGDIQNEIWKNYKRKVVLQKIPTDDQKTNELLSSGKTNGIFQLESYGMKKTLVDVGVSNLDDLAAVISLFRPGPMEFISDYANVKSGKKKQASVEKVYDEIVSPTKGILIYQEQIMEIAQKFAGMSFGRADILRRAIGKKKASLIASLKKEFIDGSVNNGHKIEVANNIYNLIERFADYGFNKSHAYAYGIFAYRMAFLKARFPYEFYTSLIKASTHSLSSLKQYVFEAKSQKINVVAPNVNVSQEKVFNKAPNIVLPLSIIKGLGQVANIKIIEERELGGKFKDFYDFVARTKVHSISDAIITSLIKGNALRDFGNMNTLINSLPQALRYANMITSASDGKKTVNFDIIPKPKMIEEVQNVDQEQKYEFGIYGFNISIFPTMKYETKLKISNLVEGQTGVIVAQLKSIKKIIDKNGNEMGIAKIVDSTNTIEAFIFHNTYKFVKNEKNNTIIKTKLKLNKGSYSIGSRWEVINEK